MRHGDFPIPDEFYWKTRALQQFVEANLVDRRNARDTMSASFEKDGIIVFTGHIGYLQIGNTR
jgi:hypothetical protein